MITGGDLRLPCDITTGTGGGIRTGTGVGDLLDPVDRLDLLGRRPVLPLLGLPLRLSPLGLLLLLEGGLPGIRIMGDDRGGING